MTTHDIAVDFLEKANPSHLESDVVNFSDIVTGIFTYDINGFPDYVIDLSIEYDVDYGWYPMCELRDRETEELMDLTSGSSIVSADLLDDLIRSLLY